MQYSPESLCDGCGQAVGPEHIARRLKRLEIMTRYRPIHVQTLFLGAFPPAADGEYLYTAKTGFAGNGAEILRALGLDCSGRPVEATLAEFQRRGYVLAHVVECAEENGSNASQREALEKGLPAAITRIRRSLKPRRVVLLGGELAEFVPELRVANLDAALVLRDGAPFEWNEIAQGLLAKELSAPLQAL